MKPVREETVSPVDSNSIGVSSETACPAGRAVLSRQLAITAGRWVAIPASRTNGWTSGRSDSAKRVGGLQSMSVGRHGICRSSD